LRSSPSRPSTPARSTTSTTWFGSTRSAPASLAVDDAEWNQRRPPAEVRDHFKKQFNARPQQVLPVYVPLWRLDLGPETGSERRVLTIDTVLGHEVDWPR